MLFGLLGSTLISYYLLSLVTGAFLTVAINANSGNMSGPIIVTGLLIVFILLATDLTLRCFSLIHRLPDFTFRWIGGALESALEHHDLQRQTEGAFEGTVDTALQPEGGLSPCSRSPNSIPTYCGKSLAGFERLSLGIHLEQIQPAGFGNP